MLSKTIKPKGVVYVIKCCANGQEYVGQTANFPERKKEHFSKLRRWKHENPKLLYLFHKYGEKSLQMDALETCSDLNSLPLKELEHAYERHPELNILTLKALR